MKRFLKSVLIIGALLSPFLLLGCKNKKTSGSLNRIDVNGVSLVYNVQGEGKPVVLIHGNGGSHKDLTSVAEILEKNGYKVYSLDSRGQGDNELLTEYHYKDMAEDVYQFVKALKLEKSALYGWSDGGIIALELEIMHPNTLSMMAISGANIWPCTINGKRPEGYDGPICGDFSDTEGWKLDINNPLVRLMNEEPRMTLEELNAITIPALVTAGDNDLIPEEHTRLIADNLPKSELVILQGEDHGSYIMNSEKMGDLLVDFLKKNNY